MVASSLGLGQANIPRWDGDPSSIEEFAGQKQYWVLGHTAEDRVYVGPHMLQVMDQKSQQYEEAKKVAVDVLCGVDVAEAIAGAHQAFVDQTRAKKRCAA